MIILIGFVGGILGLLFVIYQDVAKIREYSEKTMFINPAG